MLRELTLGAAALLLAGLLPAATLEQLSLDEMTQKSTAVVRARVTGTYTDVHGALIYTHYRVSVTERWKGPDASDLDVVVPGGTAGGQRQSFSGAPKLATDHEYILFLWTGTKGLTHIIGLSQGLFDVIEGIGGEMEASRPASPEVMLDRSGKLVHDQAMKIRLGELRTRVTGVASKGPAQ